MVWSYFDCYFLLWMNELNVQLTVCVCVCAKKKLKQKLEEKNLEKWKKERKKYWEQVQLNKKNE